VISPLKGVPLSELSAKVELFLREQQPPTPFVVIDLDLVEERYHQLAEAIPSAVTYYAVKANPAKPILERLAMLGSSFDVASPGEIDMCLAVGIDPDRISYGNTIKKRRDIAEWLQTLFPQFDPITQIAYRQMFSYGRYLLAK
jgi:ornithine decarboxylase